MRSRGKVNVSSKRELGVKGKNKIACVRKKYAIIEIGCNEVPVERL